MPIPQHGGSRACEPVTSARRVPEMLISLSSRRTSPFVFDRTHNNRTPHAGAGSGGGRSSRRMSANLEGDVAAVADDVDGLSSTAS
jgi:3-deoxy-D-manno-octulosonic acid (KDO) 8-phosphate synthase